MSILGTYTKQPSEVLDYDIDFSEWLGTATIFSQTATVTPTGTGALEIVQSSIMAGAKAVKVVAGSGVDGTKYKVTVRINTNSMPALVKEAEFVISVKEV